MEEIKTYTVRLLRDCKDAEGTVFRKGMEVEVKMHPSAEKHNGLCYIQQARGVWLTAPEYEFLIPEEEFDKLLGGISA